MFRSVGSRAVQRGALRSTLNGLLGALKLTSSGGSTVTASGSTITIGEPGGMVNRFRNGTMDVWQRGLGGSVTTAGGYTADGWIVLPTGAGVTWGQGGAGPQTLHSLTVSGATGVTDVQIKQRIESLMAAVLANQTVTVQALIYNSTGATITPTLTVKHAGSTDNWSSPTIDVNAVSLQSCPVSQWAQVAYTFQASAAANNGMEVTFDFGNNFGSNTKAVAITQCDIRVTPGLSTGLCSNPPPPELRPMWMELAFCQRYFETSYGNAIAPGTVNSNGAEQFYIAFPTISASAAGAKAPFKVNKMTGAPTITLYSPGTGAAGKIYDFGHSTDVTGSAGAIGSTGFTWSGGLSTAGTVVDLLAHWTASSEL